LGLNQWALSGRWTAEEQQTRADDAGGKIAYRFQARDVHLVMAPPAAPGTSVRYRILLDGQPPGPAHGGDVSGQGDGTLTEPRLHQLIRQPGSVFERTVEITFLDPGAQVYAFTFG
jgi:Thioredoxin like C-terminal domain